MTQTASPELVAQFNAITTNHPAQDRRVFPRNGTFSLPFFFDRSFDGIWFEDADPNDGWRSEAFVAAPDVEHRHGYGLYGYWVTGLERTITAESQLVRIFGHPIPEPATIILVAFCLLHFPLRACSTR